ncbi:hypothetical protein FHL15_006267 [Xylaria flabelliformis]|uniref:Uncharacterized protein n=1 Tax=Xylaria flabelliformis TaxID=2512241 RepID=A0A553HY31_9PEZI|nr:hypothetical protein FHL15_006267 [Xylaria flabelliformis]
MAKPFAWTIENISCETIKPDGLVFPTINSQSETVAGVSQKIWIQGIIPSVNDGVDGSFNPITIKVPRERDAQFPPEWSPLEVTVRGLLDGVVVLQSAPFFPGPHAQVIKSFNIVTTLSFVDTARANYRFWIPYRLAGDFQWQLQTVSEPAIIAPCLTTTRLEMSFALDAAPASFPAKNLLNPQIDSIPSQPDFQGMYPVLAQRYAFPNLSELSQAGLQDFDGARQWYVERIVDNIWRIGKGLQPKPVYDTDLGAAGNSSKPPVDDTIQTQNILITLLEYDQDPEVKDPYNPLRSGFRNHSWIEVSVNGPARVLDLTHALYVNGKATPEKGTKLRRDYLDTNQDSKFPTNGIRKGNASDHFGAKGDGDCYSNPLYRLPRIGIFGTNFAAPYEPPSPRFFSSVKFIDSVPYFSFEGRSDGMPWAPGPELQAVIRKGTNRPFTARFSNASLRQKTLILLTSKVFGGAVISVLYAQLEPHKDYARRSLVLSFYTDSQHHSKQLVEVRVSLDIEVHCKHEAAVESLLSFLDSITAGPLTHVFNQTPKPLGDVSLCTPDTINWIHGNVYIKLTRLRIQDGSTQTPREDTNSSPVDKQITLLADALEQHLTYGDTDRNSVHRPTITTLAPFPKRLSSTSLLTLEVPRQLGLSLDTNDFYEERVIGHTSDASVLLCCGPSNKAGRISFAALGKVGRTTVTLCQAHHENLMPGVSSFEIEVFDDKNATLKDDDNPYPSIKY